MTQWRAIPRRNKFNAVPRRVDGRLFHSTKEARRYIELKAMQAGGLITDLECQPKYHIEIFGIDICDAIPDFRYFDKQRDCQVIEDVKGYKSGTEYQMFKIKQRLLKALHGIDVEEV